MKKNIAIGILAVALVGSVLYLGTELKAQQAISQRVSYAAENEYQRNFWELSASVEAINGHLAQLLVTTSHDQALLGLSSLWREVYNAINHLGGLPVAMYELESTDLLLNDVAEYSYYLLRKNVLQQKPLAGQDWQQLEDFYRRSKVVQNELSNLETQILNEDLRLLDLQQQGEENSILTAFRSIESQVHSFPELKFEEGVRKIEPEPRAISGEQITQTQAITLADNFLKALEVPHNEGKIEFISEGGTIPVFGVGYYGDEEDEAIYVEISQKGGQILQFYQYRPFEQPVYDEAQSTQQALQLLEQLGFPQMVVVESVVDDRMVDLTLVPQIDGIYIYSDMVKMQLARDDNSLINYDQTSYATRHYQRQLPNPILSQADIQKDMNPNFQIESIHLALITDEYSVNEILTYEVRGTVVDEAFSIFVDAMNGREIRIVRRP